MKQRELHIENKYAETTDLTKQADISNDSFGKLRVYRYSPDTIMVQIRTRGATDYSHKGAVRNMISGMCITADEAETLIDFLQDKIAEIRGTNAA